MNNEELIAGLPGENLVRNGLRDLNAGVDSIAARLVAIARSRLARAGLHTRPYQGDPVDAELALYRALLRESGDAYARYNALVRELVSFEHALDRRLSRP